MEERLLQFLVDAQPGFADPGKDGLCDEGEAKVPGEEKQREAVVIAVLQDPPGGGEPVAQDGDPERRGSARTDRTDEFQELFFVPFASEDRAQDEFVFGLVAFQGIFLDGDGLDAGALSRSSLVNGLTPCGEKSLRKSSSVYMGQRLRF